MKCVNCDGCGQIADDEAGTPWSLWTKLPVESSAVILSGLVRPLPCPECDGAGEVDE